MPDYPPGGSLFTNDKKTKDVQPDYTGYLEIDRDTLDSLNDQARAGDTPKMDLSGWKKQARQSGKTFLSLQAKPPFKRDSGGGGGGRDSGRSSGGSSRGSQRSFDDAPF